jgi:hypothetical protein
LSVTPSRTPSHHYILIWKLHIGLLANTTGVDGVIIEIAELPAASLLPLWIVLGILGFIVVVITVITVISCVFASKRDNRPENVLERQQKVYRQAQVDAVELDLEIAVPSPVVRHLDAGDALLDTDDVLNTMNFADIERVQSLGAGSFGEVFLGRLKSGELVAVKKLFPTTDSKEREEQRKLWAEALVMMVRQISLKSTLHATR